MPGGCCTGRGLSPTQGNPVRINGNIEDSLSGSSKTKCVGRRGLREEHRDAATSSALRQRGRRAMLHTSMSVKSSAFWLSRNIGCFPRDTHDVIACSCSATIEHWHAQFQVPCFTRASDVGHVHLHMIVRRVRSVARETGPTAMCTTCVVQHATCVK